MKFTEQGTYNLLSIPKEIYDIILKRDLVSDM
jgi:hypothetical protein